MPPSPGEQIGPYTIAEKIGEGGMGEVYRATDNNLKRDVAIKFLPEAFTEDPERLARFQREAEVLAQLHHPNIASIFGVEESDGTRALVMELVEGPTLAERLSQGRLKIDEALGIARQIAVALEEAHAKGIVHRDLKPANVKVKNGDRPTVKVLDFGLAKALDPVVDPSGASLDTLAHSPTLTAASTQLGMILGTAAYMSPEQARGESVDKRADVWAFGCVLLEMLTGRTTFKENTVSDTLASVLKVEPDWNLLPADVPDCICRLLKRCLEKKPRQRLHDIADARIEVEATLADPNATRVPFTAGTPRRPIRTALTAALLLILGVVLGVVVRPGLAPDIAERRVRRFLHRVPTPAERAPLTPAISPDGRTIVYVFDGSLWLRDLDQVEARPLVGTDGARKPFWSPDSAHVGYLVGDSLWRIPTAGGQPALISDEAGSLFVASWGEDDRIAFSRLSTIATVPARGGEPRTLFKRRWDTEAHFHGIQWLPGGRGMLVEAHRYWGVDAIDLWAEGERTNLVMLEDSHLTNVRYVPTGHILFTRERNSNEGVWAVPFSLSSLEVTGEPFLVVPNGTRASGSVDGTLIHTDFHPRPGLELVWFDAEGKIIETIGQRHLAMWTPALSPDGTRVAVAVVSNNNERDIWIHDTVGGSSRRLTFHEGPEFRPRWSPDGRRIFYHRYPATSGAPKLYVIEADGSAQPQELTEGEQISLAGANDSAAFVRWREETGADIWTMPLESGGEPQALVQTDGDQWGPALSPDGRYLAYASEESGQPEIYVTSFPEGSGKWQVSRDGGWLAYWSLAGDRFYYHVGANLMEVEVSTDPELRFGTPRLLFGGTRTLAIWRNIATAEDEERFVGIRTVDEEDDETRDAGIHVAENWMLDFED